MSRSRLTQPYQPNSLFRALYARFFDQIIVDERWVAAVREQAARGTVVYILRSLNVVDFLALDHVTKRYSLPQVQFANLGLSLLNPLSRDWLRALRPNRDVSAADELKDALSEPNGAAALFLRRPPNVLDVAAGGASGSRGLREGEALMRALIQFQRSSDRPILLIPQVFVWTRRPDTRGTGPLDLFLGPREWPSPARVIGQFLSNYHNVKLRAGQPVNLVGFLSEWGTASESALLNKLVYTLLRRLERERRSVTGPIAKAPDRVRQEILRSRRFQSALAKFATTAEDRRKALEQADDMLRKMQALPDNTTHKALDVVLSRVFERIYHGLDVDAAGIAQLTELARDGTFVLLPSHKSHIDYLVVSYVFFKANLPLPLIVAGDNLAFFPMAGIFRRGGAFFIRRSFRGDRLYAAVVDAYVRRQVKDGFAIELFLEGMRSRTGKLLNPKFGLLSMIVSAVRGQDSRPVFFVPVSIGYERIVETESYRHEISGGEKVKEDAAGLLSAREVLRHRYGRINVQFGEPCTMNEVAEGLGYPKTGLSPKQTRAVVVKLGNRVMDEINRVTAVTPGALTALALLNHHRRGLSHDKLLSHCEKLLTTLLSIDARTAPALITETGVLRREAIREAAQMFVDAAMIEVHPVAELSGRRERSGTTRAGHGAIYTLVESKRIELDTSKNIIIHFFVDRALLATAMLPSGEEPCTEALLRTRMHELSKLLKYEFRFNANGEYDRAIDRTIEAMLAAGEIERTHEGTVRAGLGHDGWSGHKWLLSYAAMIRNFLEAYQIFVRGLATLLDEPCAEKDLIKKAIATGNRMYLAGEIERREAVSKPTLQNALLAFQDQGVVRSARGELMLSEQASTESDLNHIEATLTTYLDREGVV
jgi:glycerol-3-phosphate O-acyltransferase